MALFPPSFVEDVKLQADIVTVIQDYVPLKKTGATYKGLCPFHNERTPSFHVNKDKGFFHCFGCGAGGDVIKFLELHDKVPFPEAVRQLAERFGMEVPETAPDEGSRVSSAERESLLKAQEAAAAWFVEQLATPAGSRARQQLADRGLREDTIRTLGLGYAPGDREGLKRALTDRGFSEDLLTRAGLLYRRDDGSTVDRFRQRLMIPIRRDTGSVIAFGGRALLPDQQPKYLNSPETPVYSKSRTLYGLDLAKTGLRKSSFAILVEGYFDLAQLRQADFSNVVATCGTALTPQQAHLLRRFTNRVVLSFDADQAGQGAAAKSCELLVAEGFDVNVAVLPPGQDPDSLVQSRGSQAYAQLLRSSQPYLDYLMDRAAASHNLQTDEGRVRFLNALLPVAARIPDAAARDRFADRLAFRARVTDEVVRAEIRKAAVDRQTTAPTIRRVAPESATRAENGLIWWLIHHPADAAEAFEELDPGDLEGLASASVLDLARNLMENKQFAPSALLERLSTEDSRFVTAIASQDAPPVNEVADCIRSIKRLRYERERAGLQREIDRLQQQGAEGQDEKIEALWAKKQELLRRIERLTL